MFEECCHFDSLTKCSFESNFHFAMVAILLKGKVNGSQQTAIDVDLLYGKL